MAHLKRWRQCHAQVRALAESSPSCSGSGEDATHVIQQENPDDCSEHLSKDVEERPLSPDVSHDGSDNSDYGFSEGVLSSGSDSEAGATDEDNAEDQSNLGEEVAS